ncbi:hypothetical protein HMPREF9709_01204 [Helcococcus kunzii ATCC 51366]|uniref:Uncharacterized protein n=1 Tax=Helcococcus kunzii ATCC 51366 TaxID=883114 RepID=H3NPE3_9FIRM|nr:hypothetical protein [Helcococcus kunzii]EHR33456.1 hypothetical protein HMPREF9709_01204 [Helcococcus kunzii ATCC 51366]
MINQENLLLELYKIKTRIEERLIEVEKLQFVMWDKEKEKSKLIAKLETINEVIEIVNVGDEVEE